MKASDPLAKLLKAAARAERAAAPLDLELPARVEQRVLAATRASRRERSDSFAFLPLFRAALACSAAVALLCAGMHLKRGETPDAYAYTLNYSIAAAYLE